MAVAFQLTIHRSYKRGSVTSSSPWFDYHRVHFFLVAGVWCLCPFICVAFLLFLSAVCRLCPEGYLSLPVALTTRRARDSIATPVSVLGSRVLPSVLQKRSVPDATSFRFPLFLLGGLSACNAVVCARPSETTAFLGAVWQEGRNMFRVFLRFK